MLRSKSRSGSVDVVQKNHYSSVFSRTLSASKLCRGDSIGTQIDSNALKSLDKKPSKISNFSQNQVDRIMSMQLQMGEMEEELRMAKEKLSVIEMEKYRALDQLKEAKEAAKDATTRANESLSPNKAKELITDLENSKQTLESLRDELKTKDEKIGSLESEKNESLEKLKRDTMILLSENKKRIQELESEVEREKKSGSRMADKLVLQTKRLESMIFELEESKIETTSLHEKIDSLEELYKQNTREMSKDDNAPADYSENEEAIKALKSELSHAQEREKIAVKEKEMLKNELKLAIEGEEKSTKAMDDLALALKEVATEAKQVKEQLIAVQIELELVKGEGEQLKEMVRSTEERYSNLLQESKQETELYKNTADRLRVEAEETLLAWNGKEMGFVGCIKRAEEEKAIAQHESNKLSESLKSAENMTRAAREETYKLRDILKQAVNEANAAKAAAGIARDENSLLKDSLVEKEEALHFLTRENERLRISEAAANENVKQLKRLLSTASTEFKPEEGVLLRSPDDFDDDEDEDDSDDDHEGQNGHNDKSVMAKTFSFNLEDLKFMNEPEDPRERLLDEDPVKAEALKGSIFDANAETPKSEPHTPKKSVYSGGHRRHSTAFTEDPGTPTLEDFDMHDDSDNDNKQSSHRKSKTVFQRVGDLLTIRRSFHKKEPSSVPKEPSSATKEASSVPKEPSPLATVEGQKDQK
ncbi:hypothetical protein ACP275_12G015500 [Erythranthe tilingii]